MLGLYVTVPVACFRKGLAREYLETEILPPPSTCYGFFLSLVGETSRQRHIGCRITPALVGAPEKSLVLRTVWKIKNRNLLMGQTPLPGAPKNIRGAGGNRMLDRQELLTGVKVVLWLDSRDENSNGATLEQRVEKALISPERIERFGGLSFGESSHLIDEVRRFDGDPTVEGRVFVLAKLGQMTLPIWVDHVGSEGTRYVTGNLISSPLISPDVSKIPRIEPPEKIVNSGKPKKT